MGFTDVALKLLNCEEFQLVNALDTHKSSALHYAAWRGHADICRLILGHRSFVTINAIDSYPFELFHWKRMRFGQS